MKIVICDDKAAEQDKLPASFSLIITRHCSKTGSNRAFYSP